jgi:hypothetical protein
MKILLQRSGTFDFDGQKQKKKAEKSEHPIRVSVSKPDKTWCG